MELFYLYLHPLNFFPGPTSPQIRSVPTYAESSPHVLKSSNLMMDAVYSSETSVYIYSLHSVTFQKTVTFDMYALECTI